MELYSQQYLQPLTFNQLNTNKNPKYDEIIERIKQALPVGLSLVYVAITGGRAKGFTNEDSDYDTKSIVLHQITQYLLQDAKENYQIRTSLQDGIKVEGQAIDILKAFKYCQNGNIQLYEAFGGIPIYQTEISNKIRELWKNQYKYANVGSTFQGVIKRLQKKSEDLNEKKDCQQMTTYKLGSEILYLSLKLIGLNRYKNKPPPFNFYELIDQTKDEVEQEQIEWIKQIIKKRCEDKNGLMPLDEKFQNFVKFCDQKQGAFSIDFQKKIDIKSVTDSIFLGIFGLHI